MGKTGSVIQILTITALCAASAQAAQMSIEPVYQEVFQEDFVTVNITVYLQGSEVYTFMNIPIV